MTVSFDAAGRAAVAPAVALIGDVSRDERWELHDAGAWCTLADGTIFDRLHSVRGVHQAAA